MQNLWMQNWNTSSTLFIFGQTTLYTINTMKNLWLLFWDTASTQKKFHGVLLAFVLRQGGFLDYKL